LNNENFEDILNNPTMKETRLKMLKGEKVSQCERCYIVESGQTFGYRKRFNSNFNNSFEVVETTKEDGGLDSMKLKMWDIRISNFCNFKCRSCSSTYSSSWATEDNNKGDNKKVFIFAGGDNNDTLYDQFLPHFKNIFNF
jgi:MoaA/NifB/PqqE/SkfB family radical SAM enzyme